MTILDPATMEMLRDVMGDDFSLLLTTFLTDAPLRIAELKACLSQQNIAGMERPAHTLKGASGNIGAKDLSAACSVLVNEIRAKNVSDPAARVDAIEQAFHSVKPQLEQFQPK